MGSTQPSVTWLLFVDVSWFQPSEDRRISLIEMYASSIPLVDGVMNPPQTEALALSIRGKKGHFWLPHNLRRPLLNLLTNYFSIQNLLISFVRFPLFLYTKKVQKGHICG